MRPRTPIEKMTVNPLRTGSKACVIGAGPGGMAAAYYLRRNGIETHVYEKRAASHGIVRYAIPSFRISEEEIDRDFRLVEATGVTFHFGASPDFDLHQLKKSYDYVIVATGAWAEGRPPVKEGGELVLDALDFLTAVRKGPAWADGLQSSGRAMSPWIRHGSPNGCRGIRR